MNLPPTTIRSFFDHLTPDYTAAIERCFPRYREMLWALLDYLPVRLAPQRILELGCGTGNLTVLLAGKFPSAVIQGVDISQESLDVCRERFGSDERIQLKQQDFGEMDFEDESFDLVVSSIAIHHLSAMLKRRLFRRSHGWITPGGVFAFADQCRGGTLELYQQHIANWRRESLAAGASEEEFQMWMDHQRTHDRHDTLLNQCHWLTDAQFQDVDCVWRYLLWSVVIGRKP